jgi:hypothetical protein
MGASSSIKKKSYSDNDCIDNQLTSIGKMMTVLHTIYDDSDDNV